MIRIANPGSDISGFTRIFQAIFEELQDSQPFSLDDISAALVRRNLATSSGYSGEQALSRSTREDRSRDPLYNQSKMYSELFRMLGWMHPTAESQLSFVLTWLGAHVALAGAHAKPLVRECVLGIVFPNALVAAKGDYVLRPFALLLRTMDALDGRICRDEMIVGPLSLSDDRTDSKVSAMIAFLRTLRSKGAKSLQDSVSRLAGQRNTQVNTLHNYTRFPLAVLEWSGWSEKVREKETYRESIVFHRITPLGREQLGLLAGSMDLRSADLAGATKPVREAAAKLGAITMLERAGFDGSGVHEACLEWTGTLQAHKMLKSQASRMIFSPFQDLPPTEVETVFGAVGNRRGLDLIPHRIVRESIPGRTGAKSTVVSLLKAQFSVASESIDGGLEEDMRKLITSAPSLGAAVDSIVAAYQAKNKNEFYPAVTSLFNLIGYDCTTSRGGVNYQRWDAFLAHHSDSVPIEIKSPGEELFISVKGVRQALENKVILLSRKSAPTRIESTTLVVGFLAPNDRSEVANLIDDIYAAFGISIGVIDFRSLVKLAVASMRGFAHNSRDLLTLRGFISVEAS